jgi:hypothetical protein
LALRPDVFAALTLMAMVPQPTLAQTTDLQAGEIAYDAGRFGAAQQHWLKAADAGNATAAFDLGLLCDLGQGVPESAETAFRWYLRSADEGLAEAQLNVGVMYDSGRGVAADQARAAIWYARAAIQGNARAAFNIGQLYQNGEGVTRNPAVARAWYELAAGKIPVAGYRARLLTDKPAGEGSRTLIPPVPEWPGSGLAPMASIAGNATQLVWLAPPEPVPVVYFVELRGLAAGHFKELASGYEPVSAFAATLPGAGTFAWRVYAVSVDGSNYVVSPWSVFTKVSDGTVTFSAPAVPHP